MDYIGLGLMLAAALLCGAGFVLALVGYSQLSATRSNSPGC